MTAARASTQGVVNDSGRHQRVVANSATKSLDARHGLGMTLAEAEADVTRLMQRFRLFRDERAIFERWHELVVQHRVLGKGAHDARLVAAMERHGLTRILTFNVDDLKRYPGIEVLAPAEVAHQ